MKSFQCVCGASIFFDNTQCLACGRRLGFACERGELVSLEPVNGQSPAGVAPTPAADQPASFTPSAAPSERYRVCENARHAQVCNWLVREDDPQTLCLACRLNDVVPDLSVPENQARWARIETAKRRLLFTLLGLGLEVVPKSENAETGVAFDFKANTPVEHVLTGHDAGRITLNIDEADPVLREQARLAVNERYRTLLGHLRHEIGHYYWERLIMGHEDRLAAFRGLFGDERENYEEALKRHYAREKVNDWTADFVSDYASSHPWEDWAETFAHYLHMVDLIDTAHAFGVKLPTAEKRGGGRFQALLSEFMNLTVVLNALNHSVGQEDAYPFALGEGTQRKLAFIDHVISLAVQSKRGAIPLRVASNA